VLTCRIKSSLQMPVEYRSFNWSDITTHARGFCGKVDK